MASPAAALVMQRMIITSARDATDVGPSSRSEMSGGAHPCEGAQCLARSRAESLQLEVLARKGGGPHLAGIGEGGGWRWALFFFCVGLSVGGGQFWVLRPFTVKDANREIGMLFRSPLLESV